MLSSNFRRMDWLDGVKGIGIAIVVFGHLLPEGMLKQYIYGFHMPLFFIVYGFCATPRKNIADLRNVIIRRIYGIAIPYLLWAMIYDAHSIKNIFLILWGTNKSLIQAQSSGILWFLPVYFVSVILLEIILYYTKNKDTLLVILGAALLVISFVCFQFSVKGLPWGIDISFMGTSFMIVGYLVRKYFYKECRVIKKWILFKNICLCVIGLSVGLLVLNLNTIKGYTQMANADYGNPLVFFLTGCGVSLTLFYIIKNLYDIYYLNRFKKLITSVGINSLTIMVLHRDAVSYYKNILLKIGIDNHIFIAGMASLVVIAVTYLMSLIIAKIIPVLAGKKF